MSVRPCVLFICVKDAARVQQITAAVTGVYETACRWDGARLDELAPALAMAGTDVRLAGADGAPNWSTDESTSEMAAMHRSMIEAGPLSEPVSVPITVDGRPRGTLHISLPEGSVPVADQQFRASVNRQEALRQSFAADVAHELRTPLAILRSQLEAVQDGVLPLTPELVGSLHEETLTGAEAVSFSLERVPVDIADVVRSVTAGLQPRFAEAGLRLDTRLAPAPVYGDRTRLAQVVTNLLANLLTNLLTNAVKFVPAGGRVTVSTGDDADRVHLIVRDDGPGIPEGELPRVFDRYFRGSRARANGSGIGLAFVAALVQAHGGASVTRA